ncbi:hypothetical protein M885DRAFT_600025, partial [Pelagophyceae sp. CCMP2097]
DDASRRAHRLRGGPLRGGDARRRGDSAHWRVPRLSCRGRLGNVGAARHRRPRAAAPHHGDVALHAGDRARGERDGRKAPRRLGRAQVESGDEPVLRVQVQKPRHEKSPSLPRAPRGLGSSGPRGAAVRHPLEARRALVRRPAASVDRAAGPRGLARPHRRLAEERRALQQRPALRRRLPRLPGPLRRGHQAGAAQPGGQVRQRRRPVRHHALQRRAGVLRPPAAPFGRGARHQLFARLFSLELDDQRVPEAVRPRLPRGRPHGQPRRAQNARLPPADPHHPRRARHARPRPRTPEHDARQLRQLYKL